MLSSYDTDAVRANFHGYNIVPIRSASGMRAAAAAIRNSGVQRTVNREILVLNYDLPAAADADANDSYSAKLEQAQMFDKPAGYRTTP